jgi:hypothetical protein
MENTTLGTGQTGWSAANGDPVNFGLDGPNTGPSMAEQGYREAAKAYVQDHNTALAGGTTPLLLDQEIRDQQLMQHRFDSLGPDDKKFEVAALFNFDDPQLAHASDGAQTSAALYAEQNPALTTAAEQRLLANP